MGDDMWRGGHTDPRGVGTRLNVPGQYARQYPRRSLDIPLRTTTFAVSILLIKFCFAPVGAPTDLSLKIDL
jgi:hypothetical protein